MGRLSIAKELLVFMWVRKKWWLTPIIIFFLLLGLLIAFSHHPAVAPFIYSLF